MCSNNCQCNKCAYAQWESSDSEYSFESWVDECNCPYANDKTIEDVWDNEKECPFFITQYREYWDVYPPLFKCPECNCPRLWVLDYYLEEYNNGIPMAATGECQHCNHKFTVISKHVWAMGEIKLTMVTA